jgi:DNA-3-methyladenine glycosylase II
VLVIFQLRRLDVWPTGDLGVRRGYGLAWKVPDAQRARAPTAGRSYRPYRSVLAWYCWWDAEHYAGAAESAVTR